MSGYFWADGPETEKGDELLEVKEEFDEDSDKRTTREAAKTLRDAAKVSFFLSFIAHNLNCNMK